MPVAGSKLSHAGQSRCTQSQGIADIHVIDGKGIAVGRIFGGCRNGDTGDGGRIVGVGDGNGKALIDIDRAVIDSQDHRMIPDFIVGRGAGKDAGGRIEAEPCGQGGRTQGQGVADIDVIDGKGIAVGRIFGGCRNGALVMVGASLVLATVMVKLWSTSTVPSLTRKTTA